MQRHQILYQLSPPKLLQFLRSQHISEVECHKVFRHIAPDVRVSYFNQLYLNLNGVSRQQTQSEVYVLEPSSSESTF